MERPIINKNRALWILGALLGVISIPSNLYANVDRTCSLKGIPVFKETTLLGLVRKKMVSPGDLLKGDNPVDLGAGVRPFYVIFKTGYAPNSPVKILTNVQGKLKMDSVHVNKVGSKCFYHSNIFPGNNRELGPLKYLVKRLFPRAEELDSRKFIHYGHIQRSQNGARRDSGDIKTNFQPEVNQKIEPVSLPPIKINCVGRNGEKQGHTLSARKLKGIFNQEKSSVTGLMNTGDFKEILDFVDKKTPFIKKYLAMDGREVAYIEPDNKNTKLPIVAFGHDRRDIFIDMGDAGHLGAGAFKDVTKALNVNNKKVYAHSREKESNKINLPEVIDEIDRPIGIAGYSHKGRNKSGGNQKMSIIQEKMAGSLDSYVDKFKRDPKLRDELALQLMWGLNTFHQKGYVHKDIKPENILVDENLKNVYLSDFDMMTNSNKGLAGTPLFMQPVMIKSLLSESKGYKNIDEIKKADVYALGLSLAELYFPTSVTGNLYSLTSKVFVKSKNLMIQKVILEDLKSKQTVGARKYAFKRRAISQKNSEIKVLTSEIHSLFDERQHYMKELHKNSGPKERNIINMMATKPNHIKGIRSYLEAHYKSMMGR